MGFLESPQNPQKSQKRSAAFKRLNAEFFLKEKPCELPTAVRICVFCVFCGLKLPSWGKERFSFFLTPSELTII